VRIERVTPVGRQPGIVRCPSCGAKLSESSNPATGYFTRCSLCRVELSVRTEGEALLVSVKA
jgi:hypothetical protein